MMQKGGGVGCGIIQNTPDVLCKLKQKLKCKIDKASIRHVGILTFYRAASKWRKVKQLFFSVWEGRREIEH